MVRFRKIHELSALGIVGMTDPFPFPHMIQKVRNAMAEGLENPKQNPILSWVPYLPALAILVTITLAYGDMRHMVLGEQRIREETSKLLLEKLQIMEANRDQLELRVRNQELNSARSDEKFNLLLTLMSELKSQVGLLAQQGSENR
jgi:hypothetical protein